MRLRNTHKLGCAVEVPQLRIAVAFGEVVEIPDEQAAGLLAQGGNWTPADTTEAEGADQ